MRFLFQAMQAVTVLVALLLFANSLAARTTYEYAATRREMQEEEQSLSFCADVTLNDDENIAAHFLDHVVRTEVRTCVFRCFWVCLLVFSINFACFALYCVFHVFHCVQRSKA